LGIEKVSSIFKQIHVELTPNMRLQLTRQLAAKNHAASWRSLALPPQKCFIIEQVMAAASLGATEALAVGRRNSMPATINSLLRLSLFVASRLPL
jgi:hypothetical protein